MLNGRTALKRQQWGASTALVVLSTWDEFAETLRVERKRVLGWLRGAEPHGGAYHALIAVASRIPGGLRILLGEDIVARARED